MSLSINCRSTGPLPVQFAVGNEDTGIDESGFSQEASWNLAGSLLLRTHLVGAHPDRLFPTLSISAVAQRKSLYWVLNGIIPFIFFSALSAMCWCLPSVSYAIPGQVDSGLIASNSQIAHRAQCAD